MYLGVSKFLDRVSKFLVRVPKFLVRVPKNLGIACYLVLIVVLDNDPPTHFGQ